MLYYVIFYLFLLCLIGNIALGFQIVTFLVIVCCCIWSFGLNLFSGLPLPLLIYGLLLLNFYTIYRFRVLRINKLKTLISSNVKIKEFLTKNEESFRVRNLDKFVFWEICLYFKFMENDKFRSWLSTTWFCHKPSTWKSFGENYFEDLLMLRDEFIEKINDLKILNFKVDIFHLYYAVYFYNRDLKLKFLKDKQDQKLRFTKEKLNPKLRKSNIDIPDFN